MASKNPFKRASSQSGAFNATESAAKMQRDAEVRASRMQREAEMSAAKMQRDAEVRARTLGKAATGRFETRRVDFGFDFETVYADLGRTILGEARESRNRRDDPHTPAESTRSSVPRAEVKISPSEAARRRLMTTLPREKVSTLETFEETQVRTVIATVLRAREVDPERADWDIHIAYRRGIEVEQPDPTMVQKAQISGLLIEGTRKEARYPF